VLLHLIIKGLFSCFKHSTSKDRANNLASVLNVVTISCLFALYAISPLNSFIIYPYKLFLLTKLSANNASLA